MRRVIASGEGTTLRNISPVMPSAFTRVIDASISVFNGKLRVPSGSSIERFRSRV